MEPYQHTANLSRPGGSGFDHPGLTAWHFRRDRGRLRLTGADALAFLQALVTNDVAALVPGQSCDATYLTPQGRMITDMRVTRLAPDAAGKDDILVSVPAELAAALAVRLDFLIFAEDVQIADVSQLVHEVTLVGETMAATRDEFFPAEREADVRARLSLLGGGGLPELTEAQAEVMRIEAGVPKWGVDMNEETIPLEAGLLGRAISQTKGCYVGQEVIVRVLHRGGGRVARRLMTLSFDPADTTVPVAGTPLHARHDLGLEVGHITSAAFSKRLGRVVALAYVHRDHATPGANVTVNGVPAVVERECE
jgi:folate-binding protein YgfZ